jgi:hypothetical protein
MTGTFNSTGTQEQGKNFHPSDIKALIQKQGKVVLGNQEFTLQSPLATDPKLQAIVNDPSLTVKPIKSSNGQAEYEVAANGKSVNITIGTKTVS